MNDITPQITEAIPAPQQSGPPRWRPTLLWIAILFGGVALLALGIWGYNALAWDWGADATRRQFSNGPAPLYAFWRSLPLWPSEALRVALAPVGIAAIWIALVTLLWHWARVGGRGSRWIGWVVVPAAIVFAFSLNCATALMEGGDWSALSRPFERRRLEYIGDVPQVRDRPLEFIQNYPNLQRQRRLFGGFLVSMHGSTHPPGPILLLWVAQKWFGRSTMAAALVVIVLSSLAPATTWWLARRAARPREPADEPAMRRADRIALVAVGLHVVSPGLVLYGATCMDGVFVAPLVASAAAMLAAQQARRWLATCAIAAGAGLLISLSLMLTFGTVCLAVFFAIDLLLNLRGGWRRRIAAMAVAGAVVCGVYVLLWFALGYDVFATLSSSMFRNDFAVGSGYETWSRYFDLSTAHVVAFMISVGLAGTWLWLSGAAAGAWQLIRHARNGDGVFALSITATIVILGFSTLFTMEVERVWLWLIPIALTAAALSISRITEDRRARGVPLAIILALSLQFIQTWLMQRHLDLLW